MEVRKYVLVLSHYCCYKSRRMGVNYLDLFHFSKGFFGSRLWAKGCLFLYCVLEQVYLSATVRSGCPGLPRLPGPRAKTTSALSRKAIRRGPGSLLHPVLRLHGVFFLMSWRGLGGLKVTSGPRVLAAYLVPTAESRTALLLDGWRHH